MTELVEPAVRILPREVERLAATHPNSTWMTSPMDIEQASGWRDITYLQLSHAVNGFALWAEEQIGEGNQEGVVAYIGVNDELYGVVHIGLMKAGYKTMLPSTRNSPEGQAHLVRSTSCETLLCSDGVESVVEDFRKAVPTLRIRRVPSFDTLCDRGFLYGQYPGHCDDSPGFETLILHTSGSTGLPKPIRLTNASLSVIGNLRDLPCPYGRELAHAALFAESKPLFVMTPFFHAMGSIMMMRSIFYKAPIVRLPTGKVPNAELVTRVLEQMDPFAGIFAPALLEQLVDMNNGLETLGKLDYVFYGGAPLAKATGDKICKHTRLVSIIGSTEMGLLSSILPADPKNWEYLEWSTAAGVHMEPEGGGPHEMVIRPANALAQATFLTFPGSTEWRTQDLWEQHPLDANLWRYKGRKDDVLVLSNGEKLNPVSFEKALESHPKVHGAIVVGQGRFQTGVLLEPLWDLSGDFSASELLNELWPEVQKANAEMPSHGRVFKSKIAFATRDKPFKRAAKGSIIRNQAISLYSQEIEAMYSHDSNDESLGTLVPDADIATTIKFLRHVLERKGISVPIDAPDNADIFGYGIDSLQVLALVAALNQTCNKRVTISPRDIYQHSNMKALAILLSGNIECSDGGSREEMMTAMVEKYTHDLPEPLPNAVFDTPTKHTVILTGSTGSLGNSILAELIDSPEIERIYCFNRSANAGVRQQSAFESRGANPDFSKVTFLLTDFGTDCFGLDLHIYKKLSETVTVFIHNAWTVDFNQSLQTYEAVHIAGTRRCVDFSHKSRHKSHIVFISSVASLGNWKVKESAAEFAPEKQFDDHQVASPQGYAESKHVASLILAAAATSSGVPSTIVRCGQLAGPKEKGQMWNKHEWLPSIVLSSSSMGVMPGDLGNMEIIDWVPMDLAAKSVVEIANSRVTQVWQGEGEKTSVSHIANPSTVTWTSLVPSIRATLEQKTGKAQTALPFAEWLNVLSSTPRTPEEARSKPGIMLLDFYEGLISNSKGLPRLETRETAKLSKTIATMKAVNANMTTEWINEWFKEIK